MSIGMTWEQYWHGDREIYKIFRDAEEYRKERANYELWLQGLYIQRAFNSGLDAFAMGMSGKHGKPMQYLEYPLSITKREKEAEKQRNIERTKKWFMSEGKDGNYSIR